MKTESFEIKKYAVDYLENCGSLEYTYKEIERLYYEIKDKIKKLGGKIIKLIGQINFNPF